MSKFTDYLEQVTNKGDLKKELTKIFDLQCYKIENKIAYFKYIETDYNHVTKKSEKSTNFRFEINMLKTENSENAGISLKTAIDVNEHNIKILEQI